MSGTTFQNYRVDSLEVAPEHFKNFIFMLRAFIDRENLPCK